MDGNEELYLGMNWTKTRTKFSAFAKIEEYEVVDFDIQNSFYAKKDNTFIVLISRNNTPASLFVVPYTYKKVVKFSPSEYGEYITRLMNLVQSEFPSASEFMGFFCKKIN